MAEKNSKNHRKNINKAAYTAMFVSLLVYGMLSMTELFMGEECDREYTKAQENVDYALTPCHFDRQLWCVKYSNSPGTDWLTDGCIDLFMHWLIL
jgi:hypothetical protein